MDICALKLNYSSLFHYVSANPIQWGSRKLHSHCEQRAPDLSYAVEELLVVQAECHSHFTGSVRNMFVPSKSPSCDWWKEERRVETKPAQRIACSLMRGPPSEARRFGDGFDITKEARRASCWGHDNSSSDALDGYRSVLQLVWTRSYGLLVLQCSQNIPRWDHS